MDMVHILIPAAAALLAAAFVVVRALAARPVASSPQPEPLEELGLPSLVGERRPGGSPLDRLR